MNRPMRAMTAALAFALVAGACGTQTAPDRDPFDVPTEVVPDSLVPSDPRELYPPSGECLIGQGTGARVLLVVEDSPASGLLRAGDIITGIDQDSIGSEEQLRSTLRQKSPGDVIAVSGTRPSGAFSVDVEVQFRGDGSSTIDLGVVAETRLEAVTATDAAVGPLEHRYSRPVVLDGQIYLHEPVGGSWLAYTGIPTQSMTGYGSELYAIASTDPLGLVRVGEPAVLQIEALPFTVNNEGAPLQLLPASFGRMLTSVEDLLLIGGEARSDTDSVAFMLYGVDPASQTIAWRSPFAVSQEGNPRFPVSGYRSPDGGRAAIGVVERDLATDAMSAVVSYFLYDSVGGISAIPGSDNLPANARVTGWYDNESLAYVVPSATPRFSMWNTRTGNHTDLFGMSPEDTNGLLSIEPVSDGRHAVLIYESETRLIDVVASVVTRITSRGCSYVPVGGLTGEIG